MKEPFDQTKTIIRGRLKSRYGKHGGYKEVEYAPPKSRSVKMQKTTIKQWIIGILFGPRYTIFHKNNYVYLLDTLTGDTWYSDAGANLTAKEYGIAQKPHWWRMKGGVR